VIAIEAESVPADVVEATFDDEVEHGFEDRFLLAGLGGRGQSPICNERWRDPSRLGLVNFRFDSQRNRTSSLNVPFP
jgi:hypothetical protein